MIGFLTQHPGWAFLMLVVVGCTVVFLARAIRGEHCPGCTCDGRRNLDLTTSTTPESPVSQAREGAPA